jgi:hypothetical protein
MRSLIDLYVRSRRSREARVKHRVSTATEGGALDQHSTRNGNGCRRDFRSRFDIGVLHARPAARKKLKGASTTDAAGNAHAYRVPAKQRQIIAWHANQAGVNYLPTSAICGVCLPYCSLPSVAGRRATNGRGSSTAEEPVPHQPWRRFYIRRD